ncbi:MAG: phosphate acyltransferase PlsX [Firmicutes bacterium]|nr:phosphate acyltransferase PlsX [Bacillota bacterium]
MKIILDAFGGDNSPKEIIKGALLSLSEASGFSVVLVGNEDIIKSELKECAPYDESRIEIIHANSVITNDDIPTEAIRRKKDSSLVKCFEVLNTDADAGCLISAGSTGAVLTGAVLLVRRLKGIMRPALAPILPTANGKSVILIDCGANTDSKAINLVQFASLGTLYAKTALGAENPRIALLSNGSEDGKGNELTKEAFLLLKEKSDLNFKGNAEAREILSGDYEVVVSDGFAGNVALKACEGTAITVFKILKQGIVNGGLRAKLGYLLLKPVFKKLAKTMDYSNNGGALLLGLQKLVIKSHGSSKAQSIKASIIQAKNLLDKDIVGKISKELDENA